MMVDSKVGRGTYVPITSHMNPFQSQSLHMSNTEAIGGHGGNSELKAGLLNCMDSIAVMDVYFV